MSDAGATPLFTDTSAFYARVIADAARHDHAQAVFDASIPPHGLEAAAGD